MTSYQIGIGAGQVAAFTRSEAAPVLNLAQNEVVADLQGDDGDQTVIDKNSPARSQNLKK